MSIDTYGGILTHIRGRGNPHQHPKIEKKPPHQTIGSKGAFMDAFGVNLLIADATAPSWFT